MNPYTDQRNTNFYIIDQEAIDKMAEFLDPSLFSLPPSLYSTRWVWYQPPNTTNDMYMHF